MRPYNVFLFSLGMIVGILLFFIVKGALTFPETRNVPYYALRTLLRLLVTYMICLIVGVGIGIVAATKEKVGMVVIPILDILQSVPILGFFPIALLFFLKRFNGSEFGLELASIFLLSTSMMWSIIFGVISGVKAIPQNVHDMSKIFHISGWDYVKHIILPAIYPPLIAASILSWGSGWYFLIATEFITFGDRVYTLPGLGYYLNIAAHKYNSIWMSLMGLLCIGVLVWCINRFMWYCLNKNAKQYRFLALTHGFKKQRKYRYSSGPLFLQKQLKYVKVKLDAIQGTHLASWVFKIIELPTKSYVIIGALIFGVLWLIFHWYELPFKSVEIVRLFPLLFYSMIRLVFAYLLSLFIAIFLGYIILKKPLVKTFLLPLCDILQSVPALAYFPLLLLIFTSFFSERLGLEISSILLLMTGMLWYLIFNVIEAVEHLPREINEVASIFNIDGKKYIKHVLAPALFPAIITGSILAWGGGWNATIVSEYVNIGDKVHAIPGLGSALGLATVAGNTPQIVVILIFMSGIVMVLNHFVWMKLLNRASTYVLEET